MEDSKIVELYWKRSENAIHETSLKYGKYCFSISYNILFNNEDADECVNDTYLRAWNSIPPHQPSVLKAYLGKIVRNLSLNRYRDKKAGKRGSGRMELPISELENCLPSEHDVGRIIEDGEIANIINDYLRTLPQVKRIIFVRRYWYLDSVVDISKRYGMSEGKVKSMLFRLRNKLRLYLEKEGVYFEK